MAQDTARRKPVIMQVIPALGTGGAEQGCIDIAAELVRAGARSIVVASGGSRVHELARARAEFIALPVDSKNPVVIWRNAGRLRALIRSHGVDIVHARSRAPAWSCLLACRREKTRFMTTCHAPYNISGEAKRFYNSVIAKGERVIAISRYVADYLVKNYAIEPARIRLIPRGVPLEKFQPSLVTPERMIKLAREWRVPDGAQIVMMPGRITRWKGHAVLIDAMARLDRPDVFCVMMGPDQGRTAYHEEMEEKIRALGIDGRVRIVGQTTDMPAAYMLAAVVVSASIEPEGFGRVAVEAQAMGRPCIATDHGGAQETILRGETGWLIPPGDPIALSLAIREALALAPGQRGVLAARAMAHVAQHFSREKMADQTLNVYAELLGEQWRERQSKQAAE